MKRIHPSSGRAPSTQRAQYGMWRSGTCLPLSHVSDWQWFWLLDCVTAMRSLSTLSFLRRWRRPRSSLHTTKRCVRSPHLVELPTNKAFSPSFVLLVHRALWLTVWLWRSPCCVLPLRFTTSPSLRAKTCLPRWAQMDRSVCLTWGTKHSRTCVLWIRAH